MELDLGLESGGTFLDHVADLVYEAEGQPTKGDILITVKYRIWGDKGCGQGDGKVLNGRLGSIQIDLDRGIITSGDFQAEFKPPTVG